MGIVSARSTVPSPPSSLAGEATRGLTFSSQINTRTGWAWNSAHNKVRISFLRVPQLQHPLIRILAIIVRDEAAAESLKEKIGEHAIILCGTVLLSERAL